MPADVAPRLLPAYDAVVVGGGSAGTATAARLAAAGWSVALLEAGADPSVSSVVPGLIFSLVGSDVDWGYRTEQEEGLHAAFQDGRGRWPRGKVLGGSSALNAMLYVRGSPHDYDDWAAMGNPGWAYEDVLPFFRKAERLEGAARGDYGTSGPQHVGPYYSSEPVKRVVVAAAKELGYEELDVLDGREGFGEALGTLHDGERWSSARSYLGPSKNDSNLHVAKKCRVTKVLVDKVTKRAHGVQFVHEGQLQTVSAHREVIVSAGAIGSPQLLMLSGIGPRQHLEEVGVTPIVNLPVGDNLQDHVAFMGLLVELEPPKERRDVDHLDLAYEYLAHRRGPLAHIGATDLQGFASSSLSPGRSDLQFHHVLFKRGDLLLVQAFLRAVSYVPEVAQQLMQATQRADVLLVVPTLLRPGSRGKVRLRSADPLDDPRVFANYLSNQSDVQVLLDGVKLALRLAGTESFLAAGARPHGYHYPACPPPDSLSDDYWRCALKQIAQTLYHPAGSCHMGPAGDPAAVVDARLRVHGVQGLRIADASVMPAIVGANTGAACIMIGEKAAHTILQDWQAHHQEL